MSKTRHDGDCTIYMSLRNQGRPESGICTCGYGRYLIYSQNDWSQMYSKELIKKLEKKNRKKKRIRICNCKSRCTCAFHVKLDKR